MMIIAAAIRYDGVIFSLPAPARHHDIIAHIRKECGVETVSAGGRNQGFIAVDDEGPRYVCRLEAHDIAVHVSKQCKTTTHPYELFSEDLW